MKSEVQTKLEAISSYPFFQAVGQELPASVASAASWPLAMRHRNSRKWENCRLMARNALCGLVEQRSWERGEEWNPLVQEIRPVIVSFLDRSLPKSGVPEDFLNKVRDGLRWDILGICLEQEYRDLVAPLFYIPQLEPWYASGHFPCGWEWAGISRGLGRGDSQGTPNRVLSPLWRW